MNFIYTHWRAQEIGLCPFFQEFLVCPCEITLRRYYRSGIRAALVEIGKRIALQNSLRICAVNAEFTVGAAVRLDDGTVVIGANQENLAYPSGLCAERTAIFAAGAQYPGRRITSIAIAGGAGGVLSDSPVTPCGACRQVMAQYQAKSGKDMSVILVGAKSIYKFKKVDDILPLIFDNI